MKKTTQRLILFLVCFVVLLTSVAVVASARGAVVPTDHIGTTQNSDGTITTKYGNIPSDLTDASEYPFVLFKYRNGTLEGVVGAAHMAKAFDLAKIHQDNNVDNSYNAETKEYFGSNYRTTVILMRRDYTTRPGKLQDPTPGDQYDNYAQLMGEAILDLNGYTLKAGVDKDGNPINIFHLVTNKAWDTAGDGVKAVFKTVYTIINGYVEVDDKPVFGGNMWEDLYYHEYQTGKYYSVQKGEHNLDRDGKDGKDYNDLNGNGVRDYVDTNGNGIRDFNDANSNGKYDEGEEYTENDLEPLIVYNGVHSAEKMSDKHFVWNFNNISFKYVEGATSSSMLMSYQHVQSASSYPVETVAPFFFNYTNCTFDLTNAPDGATLFDANPNAAYNLRVATTVTGCEIIAPSWEKFSTIKLYQLQENMPNEADNSSIAFYRDVDNEYLMLTLSDESSVPAPTEYYVIDGENWYWHSVKGLWMFIECGVKDGHGVCYYCSETVTTPCVDSDKNNICDVAGCGAEKIGDTWVSGNKDLYPFVILDADGKFYSIGANFSNAMWIANNVATKDLALQDKGPTVKLRRNYTIGVTNDVTNLQAFEGKITIDLNGLTMTRTYTGAYLFDNWCNNYTTAGTVKVAVKNGTLIAEHELICLSGYNNMKTGKAIDFAFEDVTFKLSENNVVTGEQGWIIVVHKQKYNKQITSDITFTDCVFDATDMNSALTMNNAPALNLDTTNSSGTDLVTVKVTFNGGEILADKMTNAGFMQVNSNDTITFNTGSNGKNLTLKLPNNTSADIVVDSSVFNVKGEKWYFHKESGSTYVMSKCVGTEKNHVCSCGYVLTTCYHGNGAICEYCQQAFGYVIEEYGISEDVVKSFRAYLDYDRYPFLVIQEQDGVKTLKHAAEALYGQNGDIDGRYCATGYAIYGVLGANNKYVLPTGDSAGYYVPTNSKNKNPATAVIVMRRDYSVHWNRYTAEFHDNISHAQGEVVVDLANYTLSEKASSGAPIFYATIKGWSGGNGGIHTFPFTYTFKNGNVMSHTNAFVGVNNSDAIGVNTSWKIEHASATLNFENVKFSLLANNASTTNLAYQPSINNPTNDTDSVAKLNINYKDCIFDFQSVVPKNDITIVYNSNTGRDLDSDVTFENCEIWAYDASKIIVYQNTGANGSTVMVDKDDIVLKMPEGALAPSTSKNVVVSNGEVCAFAKSYTENGNDYYTLTPAVTLDYKIKTNVTLHTNFVYNIYIPSSDLDEFHVTYGNITYTKADATLTNGYYHVAVELPIAESLSDISVQLTLVSGTARVNASYTLGMLKYAETILSGNYIDVSKTLVKDMLVYAYNAHKYFGVNSSDIAANLTKVEGMLNSYYRRLPTGVAVNTVSDTYFESVTLDLGRKPAYRFYLNDEYTINDFTFTVGGTEVNAISGTVNGNSYVEVRVPAYDMLDDVAYTVTDKTTKKTVTETYNLYTYYNDTVADKPVIGTDAFTDYANLVALLESLMKYSVSADEYKYYIGNGGFGSMTLVVPKTIYANHPGSDVIALFSNGAYYGNVTWSTNNPNVFVENGKIYAVGVFASSTNVTVTAKTEHHTASATVTVTADNSPDRLAIPGATLSNPSMQGGGGRKFTAQNGSALKNNYVVTGKLNIFRLSSIPKPHIQFKLGDAHRFLFLDNDSDHIFGAGYQAEQTTVHDTHASVGEEYDLRGGSYSLDWAIVVDNNVAYWYINGELKQTLAAPKQGFGYFELGGLYMDMLFSDIKVYTEDNAGYTDRVQLLHHNMVSESYNISNTGMYVDANGNITKDASKNPLTTNYVAKGVLTIYSTNTGKVEDGVYQDPHLQFHFGSRLRFLIWDNDRDGLLGVGYEKPDVVNDRGEHHDDVELGENYDISKGAVTLEWEIIAVGDTVYFYIGGEQVASIKEANPSHVFEHFNIGALSMNVLFYDIEIYTASGNANVYSSYLAKYELA